MSDAMLKKIRTGSEIDRILSSYIPVTESGCWIWLRAIDKDGYGIHYYKNKKYRAHRRAYELITGKEIPINLVACHKCDNPSCVNPDHIFIGTVKDNCVDARDKIRHFVGVLNGRAKLNEKAVIHIRESKLSNTALAEIYGVTKTAIRLVRNGTTWSHVC